MYVCIYIIDISTYLHIYIFTCISLRQENTRAHTHAALEARDVYIHIYTCIHLYTYTHIYIYTYIPVYMYIVEAREHSPTHSCPLPSPLLLRSARLATHIVILGRVHVLTGCQGGGAPQCVWGCSPPHQRRALLCLCA